VNLPHTCVEKEHRLQNTYTPPPSLPNGINGPVVGHESANHLLRRWPPHFRDIPHEQPCPIQHDHTHKTPSIQWKAPGQLRWKSHAVAYTDSSKRDPGRAGAGVYFPNASDSILEASPLPVEEALQNEALSNPAWQGYTIAGVQNSLRAEVVALRQAVRLWNDHAQLVAFTDCLTALHMVSRYWNEPHTMALHHELPLIKDLADAVAKSKHGVDFVKIKAHANHHGSEVADRMANLAAELQEADGTTGILHLTDTESTHPAGIGLVCPWSAVSPNVRAHADPTREDGSQYHVYNVCATVLHLSQHTFERSLLVTKAHIHDNLPKSLNRPLGDDPFDPKNPHRPLRHIGSAFWYCCPGSSLRTIIRLRSSNFFAEWPAYYAGATDTPYCTICEDTTMEEGWEHTEPRRRSDG
jgi:ribonuclease HI